jgi:hypothetical protein
MEGDKDMSPCWFQNRVDGNASLYIQDKEECQLLTQWMGGGVKVATFGNDQFRLLYSHEA